MTRPARHAVFSAAIVSALVCSLVLSGCGLVRPSSQQGAGYSAQVDLSALGTDQPVPAAIVPVRLAGQVYPLSKGAYLGVYVPPAPFDIPALRTYETKARRTPAIVMWYQPWAADNRSRFDAAACLEIMRQGAVPMITWEPWDPSNNANSLAKPAAQPAFALRRIINGTYDAYIKSWADQIRELGGPIMLRPMHEMNGNWYPWAGTVNGNTPAEFVSAWRHIHDIFTKEGATNVTWVWSINHESVPASPANSYAAYYPGDGYVDWTAISGFNWGTARPDTQWRSFTFWYTAPIKYLRTLNKPICIAEFASVEKGGDKAAWITDAYDRIAHIPSVKAVVYFDSKEQGPIYGQDWRIDTSAASLKAYRQSIARPYFVGRPIDALGVWANNLSDTEWQFLTRIQPIY